MDANDVLYALEASRDYDPGPDLEKITAPLAGDQFGRRFDQSARTREFSSAKSSACRTARPSCFPKADQTRGHGSHTIAKLWKQYLEELLKESE